MDYLAAIHERRTKYLSYYKGSRKYGYGAESITISFSKGSSVAGQQFLYYYVGRKSKKAINPLKKKANPFDLWLTCNDMNC